MQCRNAGSCQTSFNIIMQVLAGPCRSLQVPYKNSMNNRHQHIITYTCTNKHCSVNTTTQTVTHVSTIQQLLHTVKPTGYCLSIIYYPSSLLIKIWQHSNDIYNMQRCKYKQ